MFGRYHLRILPRIEPGRDISIHGTGCKGYDVPIYTAQLGVWCMEEATVDPRFSRFRLSMFLEDELKTIEEAKTGRASKNRRANLSLMQSEFADLKR